MAGTRFQDIKHQTNKVLDMTSLTLEEFEILLPEFEEEFQERMITKRLDGKPRTKRAYATYKNCPLPTPEDRLFFVLSYLKSNALQTFHGQLFGMPQCKANVWIHILLPVLQTTFKKRGDTPSRDLKELEQQLKEHFPEQKPTEALLNLIELQDNQKKGDSTTNNSPLFVTMG